MSKTHTYSQVVLLTLAGFIACQTEDLLIELLFFTCMSYINEPTSLSSTIGSMTIVLKIIGKLYFVSLFHFRLESVKETNRNFKK